jgi:hypothetical protein
MSVQGTGLKQMRQVTYCTCFFIKYELHLTMSRNELPEMIAAMEPLNAGFCLTDPSDVRHRYITNLRCRYGQFLHKASASLRQQGEENTVDAVHMLVGVLRFALTG